jgi:ribosomal protein S18 acetylase RimI-like enzyme
MKILGSGTLFVEVDHGHALLVLYDDVIEICDMWIDEGYRRMGQGEWLLNECMRIAKSLLYKRIVLHVEKSNNAAINLYQKRGFHTIAEELHMEKSF